MVNLRCCSSSPATGLSHPVWQTWREEREVRLEELKAPNAFPPSSLQHQGIVEAPEFLELCSIRTLVLVRILFLRGGSYGEGHIGRRRHRWKQMQGCCAPRTAGWGRLTWRSWRPWWWSRPGWRSSPSRRGSATSPPRRLGCADIFQCKTSSCWGRCHWGSGTPCERSTGWRSQPGRGRPVKIHDGYFKKEEEKKGRGRPGRWCAPSCSPRQSATAPTGKFAPGKLYMRITWQLLNSNVD